MTRSKKKKKAEEGRAQIRELFQIKKNVLRKMKKRLGRGRFTLKHQKTVTKRKRKQTVPRDWKSNLESIKRPTKRTQRVRGKERRLSNARKKVKKGAKKGNTHKRMATESPRERKNPKSYHISERKKTRGKGR